MDTQITRRQEQQAITLQVVDRDPDGKILKVKLLNRTVEMPELIQHAKRNCPDCGPYHGTDRQGTYLQQDGKGGTFLNLCSCTVRRYVRANANGMASELRPDPDHEASLSEESRHLLADGIASARQEGTEPISVGVASPHLLLKVTRLEAELAAAQASLQEVEAWQAKQVKVQEQEVRHAEDVQIEWERRAGRAQSEEFGLTLQLVNHQDRLRVVERGLIDIKADIVQAERNLTNFRVGLPIQQAKLKEVRDLAGSARLALVAKEQDTQPRVDRAARQVEKLERRLAAARMRAGLT